MTDLQTYLTQLANVTPFEEEKKKLTKALLEINQLNQELDRKLQIAVIQNIDNTFSSLTKQTDKILEEYEEKLDSIIEELTAIK